MERGSFGLDSVCFLEMACFRFFVFKKKTPGKERFFHSRYSIIDRVLYHSGCSLPGSGGVELRFEISDRALSGLFSVRFACSDIRRRKFVMLLVPYDAVEQAKTRA